MTQKDVEGYIFHSCYLYEKRAASIICSIRTTLPSNLIAIYYVEAIPILKQLRQTVYYIIPLGGEIHVFHSACCLIVNERSFLWK
jgi:hypothetical protein